MTGAERMLAAARRQPVDATPVWFMRQAGRCLAEYRELREKYDILTMAKTPELCARVTLMPVETFKVDAAVLYADIMLPLEGMGVPFSIDPGVGPIIPDPVRTEADVDRLRVIDAEEATPYLFETIRNLRRELDGKTALIGFAGAPFTLASYMIEGRPTRDFGRSKALLYGQPGVWHQLMETLTEVTIRYLRAQVQAGVQVIQLFDSWMGALGRVEYEAHVLPHTRRIFEGLKDLGVPTIHFGTGTAGLLESMTRAGGDVISVDWRLPLDEAWDRIGHQRGIQGNLDPAVLMAPWPVIERQAMRILHLADNQPGHIFNLGHGVLADTPSENLTRLVELVHLLSARQAPPSAAEPEVPAALPPPPVPVWSEPRAAEPVPPVALETTPWALDREPSAAAEATAEATAEAAADGVGDGAASTEAQLPMENLPPPSLSAADELTPGAAEAGPAIEDEAAPTPEAELPLAPIPADEDGGAIADETLRPARPWAWTDPEDHTSD